jgi:hypothetical protein
MSRHAHPRHGIPVRSGVAFCIMLCLSVPRGAEYLSCARAAILTVHAVARTLPWLQRHARQVCLDWGHWAETAGERSLTRSESRCTNNACACVCVLFGLSYAWCVSGRENLLGQRMTDGNSVPLADATRMLLLGKSEALEAASHISDGPTPESATLAIYTRPHCHACWSTQQHHILQAIAITSRPGTLATLCMHTLTTPRATRLLVRTSFLPCNKWLSSWVARLPGNVLSIHLAAWGTHLRSSRLAALFLAPSHAYGRKCLAAGRACSTSAPQCVVSSVRRLHRAGVGLASARHAAGAALEVAGELLCLAQQLLDLLFGLWALA